MIYDDTACLLGEGPLWHPTRGEFFWFDILGQRLHRKGQNWNFGEFVSAAGWVDDDTLLVASETALIRFSLSTGARETVVALEADNPVTRSNDGRADPQGGFWIGTMGKEGEDGAGAIWRFYKGELRRLYAPVSIPNAICFAPDGNTAYFADTPTQLIMRVSLDADGWPVGEPSVHIDLREAGHNPDGAVVDQDGILWNAQWGSHRVAGYDLSGQEIGAFEFPAPQTSCPAFGGPDLTTMFCTSAAVGLSQPTVAAFPLSGQTFSVDTPHKGQAEHRVIL